LKKKIASTRKAFLWVSYFILSALLSWA